MKGLCRFGAEASGVRVVWHLDRIRASLLFLRFVFFAVYRPECDKKQASGSLKCQTSANMQNGAFPKLGAANNGYSIFGSILGSPYLEKLPNQHSQAVW